MDSIAKLNHDLDLGNVVITAFVLEQKLTWFICDKDLWFYPSDVLAELLHLPPIARPETWPQAGMQLNTDNMARLYSWMKPYHVSITQLQAAMQPLIPPKTNWDLFVFEPCFYINADVQHFVSHYSEPIEYESYIPKPWTGLYADIMPLIPSADRYWVIDGCDWISYGWAL